MRTIFRGALFKRAGIIFLVLCMFSLGTPLSAFGNEPGQNPPGMAEFSDGPHGNLFFSGDTISFSIGPIPCQAGMTDKVVIGIMKQDDNSFVSDLPVFDAMTTCSDQFEGMSSNAWYVESTADDQGYFHISGKINSDSSVQLPTGVLAIKIYSSDFSKVVNKSTGMEAYIPVVKADGTAAVITGANTSTGGPPADAENPVWVMGSDLDHVYYDGDSLEIVVNTTQFTSQIPNIPGMPAVEFSATPGIFTSADASSFDSTSTAVINMISGLQVVNDSANKQVTITGTINNPGNNSLSAGALGIKLSSTTSIPGYGSLDIPPLVVQRSDNKPALVGVAIPTDLAVTASPQLSDIVNMYNTEKNITFSKADLGSITFAPGLNIAENKEQLTGLDSGIGITFDSTGRIFQFKVATDSLDFLANNRAAINIFDAAAKMQLDPALLAENPQSYFDFNIINNEGLTVPANQTGEYIDTANITYDAANDMLIVPVKHFTTYKISRTASIPNMPVDSQYTAFNPTVNTIGVSPDKIWRVKFNQAVDETTLSDIVVWRKDIPGSFNITPEIDPQDPSIVLIKHQQEYTKEATYSLYIGSNVKAKGAGALINQATMMTFTIGQ
ncbi:MAG: hypothetical protein ABFD08_10195 [Syntrophomonas sp.]